MYIDSLETAVALINVQCGAMESLCHLFAAYLDDSLLNGTYGDKENILYTFVRKHLEILERMKED